MSEYLIKRSVERDGLPQESEIYLTNKGYKGFDIGHTGEEFVKGVTEWYEPITLPEIIEGAMPTEGEIKAKRIQLVNSGLGIHSAILRFEEWLKNKLTKQ